ncbi:hypothetical protein SBY92_001226 [Candida maltosa Xu316]
MMMKHRSNVKNKLSTRN